MLIKTGIAAVKLDEVKAVAHLGVYLLINVSMALKIRGKTMTSLDITMMHR